MEFQDEGGNGLGMRGGVRGAPERHPKAHHDGVATMQNAKLRVARPTDRLDEIVRFYREGLGFEIIGEFEDHDGFDGVMLGHPGAMWHLEFTHRRGHRAGRAPTQDNLLVFYLPDRSAWEAAIERMRQCGFLPVPSLNPYWDRRGATFEDPDGYRVVLQNMAWDR